jgi:hypothetical protein
VSSSANDAKMPAGEPGLRQRGNTENQQHEYNPVSCDPEDDGVRPVEIASPYWEWKLKQRKPSPLACRLRRRRTQNVARLKLDAEGERR